MEPGVLTVQDRLDIWGFVVKRGGGLTDTTTGAADEEGFANADLRSVLSFAGTTDVGKALFYLPSLLTPLQIEYHESSPIKSAILRKFIRAYPTPGYPTPA